MQQRHGQSHGGKSRLSRVLTRSMFCIHKEPPGREFTTARALGFRDRMAGIPLIVDDLNNRKMAEHLPDLVKADRDFAERYAPILISTNRDVQAVQPELRKRMVVVHVAGSEPRALPAAPARRAMAVGTGLHRDYLNRIAPRVPALLDAVAGDTNAALRFEKLVPAQVLRARIADTVTLDAVALERECGYAGAAPARSWLARFLGR